MRRRVKHTEEKNQMEENNMSVISMKQLLEAGVHFGHQTRRWNPKMAPYIYTERNGIYIIDLQKSVGMVDDAYKAVSDIAAEGGTVLFVGTKKQAQDAIKAEAERCGMYYVNERWLGGMLTNFKTIQSRIKRLKDIERMAEDGTFEVLPKKEVIEIIGACAARFRRERQSARRVLRSARSSHHSSRGRNPRLRDRPCRSRRRRRGRG